jgi:hypothetical protein
MWPKMLLEILPHLARLLPMWDKFLNSKAANDKATENALNAMAEGVRGDLGQVTAAHAGLYRQLQDQSAQIAELSEQIRLTQAAAERAEAAARLPDPGLAEIAKWLKVGVVAIVVILLLVIILQLTHHAS